MSISNYPGIIPVVVTTATFAAVRGTVGAIGLGAKKASQLADYYGQNDLIKPLDNAGAKLITFALRNGETETHIIEALLALGIVAEFTSHTVASEINALAYPKDNTSSEHQSNSNYILVTTFSEKLMNTVEKITINLKENPSLIVDAPLLVTLTASLAARTTAGALGVCAKVTGCTMNFVGYDHIGQGINKAGDAFLSFSKGRLTIEAMAASIVCLKQATNMAEKGADCLRWGINSAAKFFFG